MGVCGVADGSEYRSHKSTSSLAGGVEAKCPDTLYFLLAQHLHNMYFVDLVF